VKPTPELVGPGQESVLSYPRPPIVVPSDRHVLVRFAGIVVCETRRALRLLETSHPPTWYLPRADAAAMDGCFVDGERVRPQPGGFYGGWITSDLVGPFKGVPGSMGW